jgi:hypothetical protein
VIHLDTDSTPDLLRRQVARAGLPHGAARAPRVVVLGNIGNGNTGDEALLAVTLAALGRQPVITVLSRDPAGTTAMHGVRAVPLLGLTAARALARCDAVVVVGGGMFGPGLPPLVRLLPHILDAAAAARPGGRLRRHRRLHRRPEGHAGVPPAFDDPHDRHRDGSRSGIGNAALGERAASVCR